MASTSTLPTRAQKTPVVVILKDIRVSLYSPPGNVIPWYINPLLKHVREASQSPQVSLRFIRRPFEHHLTYILIAILSSFGRVWFRPLCRFLSLGHPLLSV